MRFFRVANNLRFKAIAFVFTTLVLSLFAVFYASTLYMENHMLRDKKKEAETVAKSIANSAVVHMISGNSYALKQLINTYVYPENVLFILIQDTNNKDIVSHRIEGERLMNDYKSNQDWDQKLIMAEAPITTGDPQNKNSLFQDSDRDYNSPIDSTTNPASTISHPAPIGKVIVGMSMKPLVTARDQQRQIMFIVLGIAIAISTVIIFVVVSLWIGRLDRLINATWRISHGNMNHPLKDTGNDEIGKLAETFEIMRKSLKRRDQELKKLNETLRQQVKERTLEIEMERDRTEARMREVVGQLALSSSETRPYLKKVINITHKLVAEDAAPAFNTELKELEISCEKIFEQMAGGYNSLMQSELRQARPNRNFDLYTLIGEILSSQFEAAGRRQAHILYHYELSVPRHVSADYTRTAEILTSMLLALATSTNKDNMRVHVWQNHITPNESLFCIEVSSTVGKIQPEELSYLKQQAEYMGGRIIREDSGEEFTTYRLEILLGFEQGNFSTGKDKQWFTQRLEKKHALYVSKRVGSHAFMHRVMEDVGILLVSVDSGRQAIELIKERAKTNDAFSFVLIEDNLGISLAEMEEKLREALGKHKPQLLAINPKEQLEKYTHVYKGIMNNIKLVSQLIEMLKT